MLDLLVERLAIGLRRVPLSVLIVPCPSRQGRAQGQMHQHHHPDVGVEAPCPHHVAVVHPPEDLQPRVMPRSTAVRPLYSRSNCFVARPIAGNRRKSRPRT